MSGSGWVGCGFCGGGGGLGGGGGVVDCKNKCESRVSIWSVLIIYIDYKVLLYDKLF
ncbi:MAG: hypothetical protein QMC37_03375 [Flavobacteriales bacterium]